jgi:hypothetical protein
MKKSVAVAAVVAAFCGSPAWAADNLVRFEGGVGVHPVGGIANGAPVLNVVRGVNPGGRPWGIRKLRVTVKTDGTISATGEGLVLGGSDAAGTRGGVLQVAATLFCGSNDGFNSPAADLSVGGDFEIRGTLSPTPPDPCNAPVLLIRNATGGVLGAWFAVGTFDG